MSKKKKVFRSRVFPRRTLMKCNSAAAAPVGPSFCFFMFWLSHRNVGVQFRGQCIHCRQSNLDLCVAYNFFSTFFFIKGRRLQFTFMISRCKSRAQICTIVYKIASLKKGRRTTYSIEKALFFRHGGRRFLWRIRPLQQAWLWFWYFKKIGITLGIL